MEHSLTSELADYQQQFRDNRSAAHELCNPLTREAFNWQPSEGRWSVAQCLTHLAVSGKLYSDAILHAAQAARAAGRVGTGPFRYGRLSRMMLRSLDPENQRRFKTPRKFVPPPTESAIGPVLKALDSALDRWEHCLEISDGLDLARVKVTSPALPLLRFQLGATFAMQAMHERRHLQQARAVTTAPGFPASPLEDS